MAKNLFKIELEGGDRLKPRCYIDDAWDTGGTMEAMEGCCPGDVTGEDTRVSYDEG